MHHQHRTKFPMQFQQAASMNSNKRLVQKFILMISYIQTTQFVLSLRMVQTVAVILLLVRNDTAGNGLFYLCI